MKKRKTNVQLVQEIMTYSSYGVLAQLFVIDALTKMSEAVAKADPDKITRESFVNGRAWTGVAKEIKMKLDENYGR